MTLPDRSRSEPCAPASPVATPHCAGRAAYSHDRTAMVRAMDGWRCPVCGELDPLDIWTEVRAERIRAHQKHGATSMESSSAADPTGRRYRILVEEIGEVAKEFNDAEHDQRPVDLALLRKELIQVAAMAGAWADACSATHDGDTHKPFTDDGVTYCGWDGHGGCGELWPCSTVRGGVS